MLRIVPVLYKYFNIMILPRSFIRTEIIVVYFIITEHIIFVSTKESFAFPISKDIYHNYMSLTYILIYILLFFHIHKHVCIYKYGSLYNTCTCVRFVSPLYVQYISQMYMSLINIYTYLYIYI